MTMKAAKPRPPQAPAVDPDAAHVADVDSFIARNRDDLNESIRRSRREVGEGIHASRTIDDIISDGRKRHGGR